MSLTDKQIMGKKARVSGGIFERKVRSDMEDKGWIITKWQNQVDLKNNKIIPAPHKYNFFKKSIIPGQGFPDFVCFKHNGDFWEVIGVESKAPKYLDKEEREKAEWLINNKIFDKILVGYKNKKNKRLEYYEFGKKDKKRK